MHNPTYDDLVNAAYDGLVVLAVKTRVFVGDEAGFEPERHERRVTSGAIIFPRPAFVDPNKGVRMIHHIRAIHKLHQGPRTCH